VKRILLLLLTPAAAFAIDTATFDDPATETRYRALLGEIRCLVCQNQSLADSNAPLAVDLREEVRAQIARGASDDEVVRYLTARYGDFVLYKPRFTAVTAALWLAPLLLLIAGVLIAWRALAGASAARVHDDAERARIRALLDDGDAS
jgi:cytochrome c-type biogenesis protein CcmH